MLIFDIIEHEMKKTVILKGDLTIEHATEIRQILLDALKTAEECVIDVSGAEFVDLSCLQLVCSAHRSAQALGSKMSLSTQRSEQFEMSSNEAGFVRNRICRFNSGNDCLWAEGGRQDG